MVKRTTGGGGENVLNVKSVQQMEEGRFWSKGGGYEHCPIGKRAVIGWVKGKRGGGCVAMIEDGLLFVDDLLMGPKL